MHVPRRIIPITLLTFVALVATIQTAAADTAPPIVTTAQVDKGIYVIGQDTAVTISATLPVQCAGTTATAQFYTRTNDDPTPIAPSRPVLQQESAAAVAANGAVSIGIPLPSTLEGGPDILFAGISDPSCLDAVVLLPRFIQIAILDEAENPNGSATIVVPAAALNASPNNGLGTWAKQVGSITVSANGVECTTVSLTGGPAIDAEGNARIHIGTADQPAACHEPNATLTFVNANGQTLFEKYTLLPGVTQVLQNFASEPPIDGPPPTPLTHPVYVVGVDSGIRVVATNLPPACRGAEVQLGLYTMGLSPTSDVVVPGRPSRSALQEQVPARVDNDGTLESTFPLPPRLDGDPVFLTPGIVSPCRDGILFVGQPVQVAILDVAANPNNSASIFIPASALYAGSGLTGTLAPLIGAITVFANGVECTTASLTEGPAIDAEGNARIHIGTADQPAACHEPNATLTFVNANGQTLFEKYTLLPGVTQILQNSASGPPITGGTPPTPTGPAPSTPVAPGPPNTGTGTGPSSTPAPWLIALGALAITLSATGIALTRKRQ